MKQLIDISCTRNLALKRLIESYAATHNVRLLLQFADCSVTQYTVYTALTTIIHLQFMKCILLLIILPLHPIRCHIRSRFQQTCHQLRH